ncbi:sensor histidine kinase [Chitinimonas koreensis]|uniref:sensor histidine kinase n=1 Tax=Chitinimonas koreensis TaxID=356302 RepID=UPI0006866B3E|nr:histidine kinase [Chitinimonas koreensis]QNM96115.1 histidine kinase [Chitinimonas koreensis]
MPTPTTAWRAPWRNLLVTLVVNTLAGVFFSLTSDSPAWRVMLTIHVVGLSVFAVVTVTFTVIKPPPRREPFYFVGAIVVGALLGLVFNWLMRWDELSDVVRQYPAYLLASLMVFMLAAAVIASILWGREKSGRLEAAYHAEQARRGDQEKQLMAAQMRMLQAQIEPHFLFNTLANVQSLIDVSPVTAKKMLGLFNDYLRASLARTRDAQGTVRQELDLLRAYLGILQIRMAERLEFELDCPPGLLDAPLPPMLLQPLVENAVRHGLEPKVEGGTVRITISVRGDTLLAEVSDDGLGLQEGLGSFGMGLANVRARLSTLYDGQARLELAANAAGGVSARIELPLRG